MSKRRTAKAALVERLEMRRLLAAHVWSGAGLSADWSDAGNWSSGGVPAAAESAVTIDFPASPVSSLSTNDIVGLTIDSITVEDPYTVSGQAITMNGSISSSGNGALTMLNDISLAANLTVHADAYVDLGGTISGSYAISKDGTDMLALFGSNTYTGLTTASAGTLYVGNDNALGDVSAGTSIASGAALIERVGMNVPEPLTIDGAGVTGTPGALRASASILNGSSTAIWAGSITLAGDSTLATTAGDIGFGTPASTLVVGGVIGGTGNVTVDGAGTVVFAASTPNTYAGSLTVAAGELLLQGAGGNTVTGNVEIAANASVVDHVSEQIDDLASVTVDSGGTLQLDTGVTETAASFSGAGILDGSGTLVDNTTSMDTFSGQINGSANLTMAFNGRINLTGSVASTTTGTITAENGLLVINTDLSSATVDMEGGELAGGGTIGTLIDNYANIQAGSFNPGTLNVVGDATLNLNSWFDFIAVDDSTYTALNVGGHVTLDGNFSIYLLANGYTPAAGKVFTIVANNGGNAVSGTFAGTPEGQVLQYQNADWKLSYLGGSSGHDITLTYLGLPTTTTGSAAASPVQYGQAVLHAAVAHTNGAAVPTGSVTFKEGATVIGSANLDGSGDATLDATSLTIGAHTITAIYGGDSVYEGSTIGSPIAETIVQIPTTVTLIASAANVNAGSNVSFVATVSPATATGTVTFSENGVTLGADTVSGTGRAALDISTLGGGTHNVIATYSGDTNDTGSVAATAATVNVVPSLSIANVTVTAGAAGATDAVFTVTLDDASTDAITVDYATANGTATAGADYVAASGTLTFAPGQTSKTIDVHVPATALFKPTEAFTVELANPAHANLATAGNVATGTIRNGNDGMPQAGPMPDPFDSSKTDFVVLGTAGNDNIQIKATKVPGQVLIKVNKTTIGPVSPTGYLIVYGGAGNDHIVADAKVTANLILIGGAGNDVLTGGAGNDILIGGDGNDTLNAGGGMNIQIGGSGAEHLKGSRAGDVLIGAASSYDAGRFSDLYALNSLMTKWTSAESYAARVADMAGGVGALNAQFSSTTIISDSATDHLTGTAGHDWLIPASNKTRVRMAHVTSGRKSLKDRLA